jgi:hypothetical protein
MDTQVRYWIRRFQEGDREGASFGLLDMGPSATADLVSLFHETSERDLRRYLAWIIRRGNDAAAISFFEEATYDADPDVWREGIDGLVWLATEPALNILETAMGRQFRNPKDAMQFREWLEEAIEQVKETIQNRKNQTEFSP